ncbi:hypothetical protein PHYSODRAFT_533848 [Phytophthora sojae]|uniref:SWIM-type domain-containing protein n=1 Tax=Phytophthora sojae (strain P6497) TaxID=1094619 RepID=G5AFS2_PHYSP|nr:hypothetical protein PHYSODRAFT_533848 [Phytophthora sojae]EGZ05438.1 hypothetical protein PHYSODRAFT_533848 [Phytophthora sojae]|eukprot:XP_009538969.1 hypothetical protein PHYSODRAFT_533848 [Phytophthora sojae]
MCELMTQLAVCCRQRGVDLAPFATKPTPSKDMLARVRALRSQQRLREFAVPRMSVEFLLGGSASDVLHVLYTPPPRVFNPATNTMKEDIQGSARIGVNTARMENKNQPETGWPVDMVAQTCPCRFHFKYATCVHVLFALQERARIDERGAEVLVNRRVTSKRKRATVGNAPTAVGRPPRAGPALERE